MSAFSEWAFPGEVVDWAIVTDWDLVVSDRGILDRVMRWAELAVNLKGAESVIAMRDDFRHRYIYVATKERQ